MFLLMKYFENILKRDSFQFTYMTVLSTQNFKRNIFLGKNASSFPNI